jgi:aspartyl-tRNA(Asn)/glutamyl-tRNA(Gln) amidotransferase subunit C
MSVSHDDVRHIASLARVGVDERRLPALAAELSGILEHMAVLARVDTTAHDALAPDAGIVWRADSGPPIPLLRPLPSFAPVVRDGFLIVPRLATHGGEGRRPAAGGGARTGDERPGDERPGEEDSE